MATACSSRFLVLSQHSGQTGSALPYCLVQRTGSISVSSSSSYILPTYSSPPSPSFDNLEQFYVLQRFNYLYRPVVIENIFSLHTFSWGKKILTALLDAEVMISSKY